MLKWSALIFIFLCWILGIVLGGMIEKTTFGDEEMTVLNALMTLNIHSFVTIDWFAQGAFNLIPKVEFPWFGNLWQAATWDFALFEGTWGSLIKMGFYAVTAATFITILAWGIGVWRGSGS